MPNFMDALHVSEPMPSFHFVLTVELVYDIPLKAVRNINKQNAYEHISEGGLNDYVHMRRKQVTEPFTFEVERYLMGSFTDPLSNGTELTLPVILWVDKWRTDGDSESGKLFVFTGVKVVGKSYGELNSEQSGLATETVTLAYNNMYVISNYASLIGLDF